MANGFDRLLKRADRIAQAAANTLAERVTEKAEELTLHRQRQGMSIQPRTKTLAESYYFVKASGSEGPLSNYSQKAASSLQTMARTIHPPNRYSHGAMNEGMLTDPISPVAAPMGKAVSRVGSTVKTAIYWEKGHKNFYVKSEAGTRSPETMGKRHWPFVQSHVMQLALLHAKSEMPVLMKKAIKEVRFPL